MEQEHGTGRPQRIVVVNASGDCSGAEAVMLDLVDLALADDIEVVVASPVGPLVDRLPPAVRHVPLPMFGLGGWTGRLGKLRAALGLAVRTVRTGLALRREVRRPGTHTVSNSLLALPALRLARPASPATWLAHDVVVLADQRRFVSFALGRRRSNEPRSLGLVVAVSEATAAPLRRLGCDVLVRPNGVRWPVEPVPLEQHSPPVVGEAALLVAWKGQSVVLDAVASLPGIRCELAGGTIPTTEGYRDALAARAAQPDLAGRVRFLGHVDAIAAMRGWDVAVLASTSPEAGPLTVLEAMSLGLPVVATDHGGSAELLADGCGILVPPGDPAALARGIVQALDDAVRPALAAASRQRVAAHHDRSLTLPAQYETVMLGRRDE